MSEPEHIGTILWRVMAAIGAPTELCETCGRTKAVGSINGVAVCRRCHENARAARREERRAPR